MIKQCTLEKSVAIKGVGLHSGKHVLMTLAPATEGSGIVFVRADITDSDNVIPALWSNVADTQLCTVIANEAGASVGTIEHLMAALRGCGIDNVVITLNGQEVPIMDGSAMPFVEAIEEAGIVEQEAPRRYIRVLKEVRFEKDGKVVTLSPSEESEFTGDIEFTHPSIGRQEFSTQLINGDFKHDIAEARTFGFLHEVEYMRRNGLALGGSLDNAIVLDQDAVMNEDGLRFDDEFIRHKILDAIGDLYLAGAPIMGVYDGHKAGHEMNNLIVRALFADDSAWEFAEKSYELADPIFAPNAMQSTAYA